MASQVENQYTPDVVSAPGETLFEVLEDRGMSQAELASRMGRPKKTINEVIKGKAAITSDTGLQLERVLGVPASFWTNLEQNYRDYLARVEEERRLAEAIAWLRQFPLRAMRKAGWITAQKEKIAQVKELLNFFGIASPAQWETAIEAPQASFRQSSAFEMDHAAVAAWLRQGYREASTIECEPYDRQAFRRTLNVVRELTIDPPEVFVPSLRSQCAAVGVAVVFVRPLPRIRVFGATRWLSVRKAVIQLSLRYKSNDQLWFSFFHEAGHIYLHGKREVFLEGNGADEVSEEEDEANQFAANLLIPPGEYSRFAARGDFSDPTIRAFASDVGIAPGIVVGRLQHEGRIPFKNRLNSLKVNYEWA